MLALWFALVASVIGIWHDIPVIDDWTYAWTVEHLVRTGTFDVLDWSSAYPLSQALWGAAWSTLLGFSFTTLSLSTLALAAIGCCALYALLRELGASTRMALVGALSLAVNPLFVFLSSSFMTDVPFITFTTLALLCYVLAARRGELRFVWWAAAWSFAAFLTRQVGIVTPVAGVPLLLMPTFAKATVGKHSRPSLRHSRVALSLIATWGVMLMTWMLMRQQLGVTSVMQRWSGNLYAGPADYLVLGPYFFALISFYLLPVLLADASVRGVWRRPWLLVSVVLGSAVLLFIVHGGIPLPLRPDQTWSLYELGSSRALVHGPFAENTPTWIDLPARTAGLVAFALLLLVAVRRLVDRSTRLPAPADPQGRFWSRAPLIAYLVAYLGLVNLLWMYNDRYYLVLVPPLVALILGGHTATVGRLRLAASALFIFAVIALVGTRDAQRFNQAVRDVSQSLIDAGVPPSEIDAGYAWNGWMLYAHPSNLAQGLTPWRDVPWITSDRQAEYIISKTRDVQGYTVERAMSWWGLPWPGPNQLFVLKRTGAANNGASVSATTLDTR